MCEVAKGQRRTFRDQDPPRICQRSADSLKDEVEFSKSAPNSQGTPQRAASLEKCFGETEEFVAKDRENRGRERGEPAGLESGSSDSARGGSAKGPDAAGQLDLQRRSTATENFLKELADKVPSSARRDEVQCTLFLPL